MIAITTMGYSYACSNNGVPVDPYGYNCDVMFTKATTKDNEIEKNVAEVHAQITHDGDTINIYITNAYPHYEADIDFIIKNKGNKPAHIDDIYIEEYDKKALEIDITNIACTWINPSQTISGLLKVHTLPEAKQNWQYTFKAKIKASFTPQRQPHTTSFWKSQFQTPLSIPAETLEQYLNQITIKSKVFSFAGTQKQKFQQAINILDPPSRSSMEAKFKAQLLALWLNYIAGYAEGYKLNSMTAYEIIQDSENALTKHQTSKYEYWKNLCDNFNNLK